MMNPFEIPDMPDAATDEEWDAIHEDRQKRYPIRYFLSSTLPIAWSRLWRRVVHDPWYWLKCRAWHQYNVVRIRTLPPTWTDRDSILLHGAFQVLTDFVEKEKPFEWFDTEDSHNKAKWDEIRILYEWWKTKRPARIDPLDNLSENYKEWTDEHLIACHEFDDACLREDDEMLARLVAVRHHLWT